MRRSAVAAALVASLELARQGQIELQQAAPFAPDHGPAAAMSEPSPKHVLEALLFAAAEPLDEATLQAQLGDAPSSPTCWPSCSRTMRGAASGWSGMGRAWAFRTAPEVAPLLSALGCSRASCRARRWRRWRSIAYQQPVTRAEIEAVRGVALGQGTLDMLVEAGWVAPKGRREAPGRPVTWVTTPAFLDHFALGCARRPAAARRAGGRFPVQSAARCADDQS